MSFLSRFFGSGPSGRVDGQEARRLVQAGAILLDVRSPEEFKGGALPGARNIPVQVLDQHLPGLDRSATYVLYCASGMRSARGAAAMRSAGFTSVHDLGGMANG